MERLFGSRIRWSGYLDLGLGSGSKVDVEEQSSSKLSKIVLVIYFRRMTPLPRVHSSPRCSPPRIEWFQ